MYKKEIRVFQFFWMILVLFVVAIVGKTAYASGKKIQHNAPQNVRAIRHSNTAIRLRWKADSNVDGYIIL